MSKSRYRPEHMRMLNDRRWAETKAIVDARSGGRCEWCARNKLPSGLPMAIPGKDHHHLIPFESAKTIQEAKRLCYDPNNVVLLCVPCHVRAHQQLRSKTKEKVKERRQQSFERWKDSFRPAKPDEPQSSEGPAPRLLEE